MANLKSSQKDIRRIRRRTEHNRAVKSKLKTLRKSFERAVNESSEEAILSNGRRYISALDKAAKRNIISKNKAKRHKSQCSKHFPTGTLASSPVSSPPSSSSAEAEE